MVNFTDGAGGSGRAMERLHAALRASGVESRILASRYRCHDNQGRATQSILGKLESTLRPRLEALPVLCHRERRGDLFSVNWLPDFTRQRLGKLTGGNILHLHWPNAGMLRLEGFPRLPRPLIWTLHDCWAFTGGCHFPGDCMRLEGGCGTCPALGSRREDDLAQRRWKTKQAVYRECKPVFIAPSRWMLGLARRSALLRDYRVEHIPYTLDLELFSPRDKALARATLGLESGAKYVLFGAVGGERDPRKGGRYLMEALQLLHCSLGQDVERIKLLVFGADRPTSGVNYPLPVTFLGNISDDDRLAMVYSAADVLVAPSLEDNLPNVVIEASACGIPTVAFRIGGMPDLIDHESTGYLAESGSADSLAEGILWVLAKSDRMRSLGNNARSKALVAHDRETIVSAHIKLYQELLTSHRRGAEEPGA